MRTLLYVASRWPYPVRSGRARMIAQTLEMASATHRVVLAAFADPADVAGPRPDHVADAVALRRPGIGGSLASVVRRPLQPLQSHLFRSGAAENALAELAERIRPDVAMLDMIRLAGYAPGLRKAVPGLHVVLDMDDLLSRRYAQMDGATGDILGAFSARMPKPIRRLAGTLPGLLLAAEGRLVARAEARAMQEMDAVVLVSPREAEAIRGTGPAPVHAVPPSVEQAPVRDRDFSEGVRFVFLGDEAYAPNAEALRHLQTLAADVGTCARPHRFEAAGRRVDEILTPDITRHGFVDDLDGFLGPDAVMVAPILTGTGIKTKLLDAMVRGVPVVTTPRGAEGLTALPGAEIIVCQDVAAMFPVLRDIASGTMDAKLASIGRLAALRVSHDHAPRRVATGLVRAVDPHGPHEGDWQAGMDAPAAANDPVAGGAPASARSAGESR